MKGNEVNRVGTICRSLRRALRIGHHRRLEIGGDDGGIALGGVRFVRAHGSTPVLLGSGHTMPKVGPLRMHQVYALFEAFCTHSMH
jgi:hypothetical protein